MSSISELRYNSFSALDYESDEEVYNEKKKLEKELKEKREEERRASVREKQRLRSIERQKKSDEDYVKSLKRTKIMKSIGIKILDYVCEIVEDGYNIARYLSLDESLQNMVEYSRIFYQNFDNEEYLYLVKIMETNKNPFYYDFHDCLRQLMSIDDPRIFGCLFQSRDYGGKIIYQIYKYFLFDTPNMRRVFEEKPHLKGIVDESLEEIIKNPYGSTSESEQMFISKYFELGKRFYAKRNNFKVLFRNYCKFIGKMMVIKNKKK